MKCFFLFGRVAVNLITRRTMADGCTVVVQFYAVKIVHEEVPPWKCAKSAWIRFWD